jgi:magnesium-transporting ATPase (P-type)
MPSLPAFENGPSPEMLAAVLAGFMTIILIVGAGLYLYSSLCLFLIAKKLDVPAAWTAWIPIIQVWTFFQSAGKSLWWILLFFIPFVNLIVVVYLWMCIAENLGKNKWLGLLALVPIANLILPAVLAFSKKEGMEASRPAMD